MKRNWWKQKVTELINHTNHGMNNASYTIEKKQQLEKQSKDLENGAQLFKSLLTSTIDLSDADGNAQDLQQNLRTSAKEHLAPKKTYTLIRIGKNYTLIHIHAARNGLTYKIRSRIRGRK